MVTKVDDRGRVLIPKEIRERVGLEPGSTVLLDTDGEGVQLRPALNREEAMNRLMEGITDENAREEVGDPDPLGVKEIWEPDP